MTRLSIPWIAGTLAALLVAAPSFAQRRAPSASTSADTTPPPVEFPGGIVWHRTLPSSLAAQPAFDLQRAYVPLKDGTIVALSLVTGDVEWTVSRRAVVRPEVAAGLLVGVDEQTIWALGATDGTERWSRALPGPVSVSLAVSATTLVLADAAGELVAADVTTGETRWSAALGTPPAGPPVIAQNQVLAGLTDGKVVSLALDSGRQTWARTLPGPAVSLTAADSRVFVGSADNFLYCLALGNGAQQWRWRTGGDVTEPAASDDRNIYFVAMDNVVRALKKGSGNLVWQSGIGSRPAGGPLLADDRVFVAGIEPEIRAFAVKDGRLVGRYVLEGRLGHAPVLVPGEDGTPARLVVVTGTGVALAIGGSMESVPPPLAALPGPVRPPNLLVLASGLLPVDGTVEVMASAPDTVPGTPVPSETTAPARNLPREPELVRMRGIPGTPAPPRLLGGPVLALDGAVEPPVGPLDFLPGKVIGPEIFPF